MIRQEVETTKHFYVLGLTWKPVQTKCLARSYMTAPSDNVSGVQ